MEKTKVVVDTNILVSSLWGGKPSKIIELWDQGKIVLVVSQQILDEYFAVLKRFNLADEDMEELAILFSSPNKVIFVEPKSTISFIDKDPDDNKFLEAALEGNAKFVITGDKHLLKFGELENIEIVKANEFISLLASWEIV